MEPNVVLPQLENPKNHCVIPHSTLIFQSGCSHTVNCATGNDITWIYILYKYIIHVYTVLYMQNGVPGSPTSPIFMDIGNQLTACVVLTQHGCLSGCIATMRAVCLDKMRAM